MNNTQDTFTDEFEVDLSEVFSPQLPQPVESVSVVAKPAELPPPLAAILEGIRPPGVREFTREVFADIIRLLGRVECVRMGVERGAPAAEVSCAFVALRKSTNYLLTSVETAELRVDDLSEEIVETLEAMSFALGRELRRVFENDLAKGGVNGNEHHPEALRACALLENCLQQITIALARTFDAGVTGAALFENYRRRREESLILRAELRGVLDDIRRVEAGYTVLSSLALLNRVRRFRYESLHYLMYRDWEDFERFADALELCYESEGAMRPLLNSLSCYVGALANEVEMRAVLKD